MIIACSLLREFKDIDYYQARTHDRGLIERVRTSGFLWLSSNYRQKKPWLFLSASSLTTAPRNAAGKIPSLPFTQLMKNITNNNHHHNSDKVDDDDDDDDDDDGGGGGDDDDDDDDDDVIMIRTMMQ
ncbi:hypothetical protein PoB_007550500 [Plakobranchus ocellatus]|uniref:Uncharacterized protein n=1 Tax=Plakobranchus ocellatus TaxID=259542 RepID=A0AAV4DXU7_9GAST|nr:hypothetical protein PoB_007550500 [Plakobranchus ocellatus]